MDLHLRNMANTASMRLMKITYKYPKCNRYLITTLNISACIIGFLALRKIYIKTARYIKMRRIRLRKLEQLNSLKEKLSQKLIGLKKPIENRNFLTNLSYDEVRKQLRNNKLHAIDLLEAYQAKALEVDRSLNCIADLVHNADVKAIYLDSLAKEKRGRLHGIPLSVKECVNQVDFDSYFGCVSQCFSPNTWTANVVKALMMEGMIPFVRTTMSQCGITIDGNNPLFGETLNPHDLRRTCGGSSGGEGALIGGRGSIAGIGTDVIGGVRIPPSYCGIFGLKPTSERMGRNNISTFKYQLKPLAYEMSVGPMSNDLDLLVDMTRVLFSTTLFDLDDSIPRLHFNEESYECKRQMKVGFYRSFSDNYLTLEPCPSIKRGVSEAKAILERRGHIVVEWEPPRIAYACDLQLRCLFFDGGECARRLRREEAFLTTAVRTLCSSTSLSSSSKFILSLITRYMMPLFSRHLMRKIPPRSAYAMVMLMEEANAYKEECAKAWNDANLDCLICPVIPFTAPLVGDSVDLLYGGLYTNLYNFLDYPAGVVPVSRVTEEDIIKTSTAYPRSTATDRKVIKTQMDSIGMPVCVQCVARKWQDEKALRLMKELQMGQKIN